MEILRSKILQTGQEIRDLPFNESDAVLRGKREAYEVTYRLFKEVFDALPEPKKPEPLPEVHEPDVEERAEAVAAEKARKA